MLVGLVALLVILGVAIYRKEQRRHGGDYWVAYRKVQGRLHKTYLGKSADLQAAQLDAAAVTLTQAADSPPPPAAPPASPYPGPAALLTGPEGGFDDTERAAIRALPQTVPISLGPRILRGETAALAGIAAWMAIAGDWGGK